MKYSQFITLSILLFPFALIAMNFEQDNPTDKVVRLRCAWRLHEFTSQYLALGHTPLYLYDSCMNTVQSQEKKCQEDIMLKDTFECKRSALEAERDKCQKFYKKALEVVHNCDPGSPEKELREINVQKSLCKKSCLDMQKRCYLSTNDFLLSSQYAFGAENRARSCGLSNYLKCRYECLCNFNRKKNQIINEWEEEKRTIELTEHWNRETKLKHMLHPSKI